MMLDRSPTPAPLAYDGLQYPYMAPQLFTEAQFAHAEGPEAMKDFDRMGYAYAPERSDGTTYVFLRENRPGR